MPLLNSALIGRLAVEVLPSEAVLDRLVELCERRGRADEQPSPNAGLDLLQGNIEL